MSLELDVVVKGVQDINKMAKAFEKATTAMIAGGKAVDKLSKNDQKLISDFKEIAAAAGVTAQQLMMMVKSLEKLASAKSAIQNISGPFTKMSGDINKVRADVVTLNADLKALGKSSALKLGDQGYMDTVRNAKASLILQKQLNAEIEKQAQIQASIDLMSKPTGNKISEQNVANLKQAQAETRKLRLEHERLNAVRKASIAQQGYARESMKGIEAATKLIGVQQMGVQTQKQLKAQMIETAAAGDKLIAAQRKQAQEGMKGVSAAERLIGVQRAGIESTKQLKRQMEEYTIAMQKAATQAKNLAAARIKAAGGAYGAKTDLLSKTQERLGKLKVDGVAAKAVKRLKEEVHQLNLALATTGKLNTSAYASINRELKGLETQLNKTKRATTDWSKKMQYAVGGVARSFGAMTYSYAQLAPLMAGIAAGAAVKKVYELGAAFEYTTTYVDALGDSLSTLDAGGIQQELLSFEGLRKGPEEMAQGMKEFAKAGVEATTSLAQIEEMAKFATIAELELGDAAKLVIGQSQAFDQSFTKSANIISAAALSSATDIQELATALSYTTELATVSGTTFEEVATAMAIMANAGIRGCYDRETDVLTLEGWKKWEDVTYDDEFATYNSETGELEYQEAERLVRYHHNGPMYRVANKGIDLCVTPDHRMYVKKRGKDKEFEILTAIEIEGEPVEYKLFNTDDGSFEKGQCLVLGSWIDYDDEVFCAEVPNGLLIVRRNGRASISGNSKAGTAIRTSILKMQAPSATLKKQLDELGISWSAFTEGGQIKDLRTMFTELKRVTDALPSAQRISILKELFGLRSLKGGANILRAQGEEWDSLYEKISKAGEELDFVGDVYDKLEDTATAKLQKLQAEAQKSFIKAFDSEGTKAVIDNLAELVASEAFIDTLKETVQAIDDLARAVTGLGSATVKAAAVGGFIKDLATVDISGFIQRLIELGRIKAEDDGIVAWLIRKDLAAYDFVIEKVKGVGEAVKNLAGIDAPDLPQIIADKAKIKFEVPRLELKEGDEIGRLKAEIERAMDTGQDHIVFLYKEKLAQLQSRLEDVASRAQLEVGLGASFVLEREGMKELSLEGLAEFNEEIQKLDFSKGLAELEGWDQQLEKIRQASIQWGQSLKEPLDENHIAVKKLAKAMEEELLAKGLSKMQTAIDGMKFDAMIGGLRAVTDESKILVNKLTADFLMLKEKAYQELSKIGQAFKIEGEIKFTDRGKDYFKNMIAGTRLFETAIKNADDKVKKLKENLFDLKLDMDTSIFDQKMKVAEKSGKKLFKIVQRVGTHQQKRTTFVGPKTFNYIQQLKQIRAVERAAKKAAKAGDPGRKREIALLKKAWGLAKQLSAEGVKGGQSSKLKEMQRVKKKLLTAEEKSIKAAKDNRVSIEQFVEKAKKGWLTVEEAATMAKKPVDGYLEALKASVEGVSAWEKSTASSILKIKQDSEALQKFWESMTPPKQSGGSPYDTSAPTPSPSPGTNEAQAIFPAGGTSSGFAATAATGSTSRDVVDINLKIGNGEPIAIQGPRRSVDELQRAFNDKERFGS